MTVVLFTKYWGWTVATRRAKRITYHSWKFDVIVTLGNQIRRATNSHCLELCNATSVPMSNQVCVCVSSSDTRSRRHSKRIFCPICSSQRVLADYFFLGQLICINVRLRLRNTIKFYQRNTLYLPSTHTYTGLLLDVYQALVLTELSQCDG